MITIDLTPGDDLDVEIQCRVRGTGAPALYDAGDTLSGDIWQPGAAAAIPGSSVAATWRTLQGTQTGYDQGQVVLTPSAATVAALMPSVRYTMNCRRRIAGTSRVERIATVLVRVRPQAPD